MNNERVYRYSFASIHALYVTKVERKGRLRAELDEVLRWLTGLNQAGLDSVIEEKTDLQGFFANAPCLNPARDQVTGVICGVRIEQIEDRLMKEIRIMDKLVDELAKGRAMAKILRGGIIAPVS
jgi:hypothetical protein